MDRTPRIYFSGAHGRVGDEAFYHEQTGWNGRCFSFEYWDKRTQAAFGYCKEHDIPIMFDSGAFSLQKQGAKFGWKEHDQYLDRYAAVLDEIKDDVAFYLALDFRRKGFATTESCRRMRRRGFPDAVPTYHGNVDFRALEELCADYPLVAIAQPRALNGTKKDSCTGGEPLLRFYDRCFEIGSKYRTRFHGLSQFGRAMFLYPWDSVDATSWDGGSKRGRTISIDALGHITTTPVPEVVEHKRLGHTGKLADCTVCPPRSHESRRESNTHNAREYVRAVGDIGTRLHRPPELRAQSEAQAIEDLAQRIASAPRNDLRLHRFRLKAIDTLGDHRGQLDPETGEEALYLRAVLLRQLHWGENRVEIPGEELRRELRAFQARYLPRLTPGLMTKVIVNSERLARRTPRFTNACLIEKLRITPQEQRMLWPHTPRYERKVAA